jgi:threonylcarbamoyladenosine tRNA methylthiotransferase MtaB
MKKVSTYTLGCKLNFAESSAMAQDFLKQGYTLVPFGETADVTIINTCSVTEHADAKCRNVVRKALKHSPESFVAVVGCYAQLEPEELASIDGVDAVLGAKEKFEMASLLGQNGFQKQGEAKIFVSDISTVDNFGFGHSLALDGQHDQTRAYLKVQDGCDYSCSYCTIPMARGASRSESVEKTVMQAKMLAASGYKEIVLTGVNIGDFGVKSGTNFFELLKELDTVDIPRIRISSIEPNLLTSDMIDFISRSTRIVPHFHLPMQSGSAEILKLMRRRYNKDLYRSRVDEVISKIPHCCIGADVIVGFPGETDAHFEETYHFIESLPIAYLHVFTFSERPNTHAAELLASGDLASVAPVVKKARNQKLHELSYFKKKKFVERYLGETHDVLFENEFSDDAERNETLLPSEKLYCYGHTTNYLRVGVEVASKESAAQTVVRTLRRVKLMGLDNDLNVVGELV